MLGKLKDMFGSKKPSGATQSGGATRRSRVNLQRRFTLVALTGQGSMSRVHRAVDNQTGRVVCLKIQIPEKNEAAAARSAKATRPPEGEISSQVIHPHVVKTYDYGQSTKGEHFLAMEFIEGVSLKYVRESHSTNLGEKLELLAQAAEGLAAVHAHGFIHHDVGPQNFLVDRDQRVKLIDFGLAVPNTPLFNRPGNRTGTLQYMAPELIRRETTDERLDIFSFGALAFEFLTDRLPYDAGHNNSMAMLLQRINSEPLDPALANPRLPSELTDLIRKLIARRKADRWPSMANLAEAFRSISIGAAV
ncbi:serine/threonine-protein kinase [Singulisphaera sp. Ch08]|uniref:Serine/threonine-protein kinase n=1 Tax=Singulisphaera sp. Ch08 TaxID=3120278 RepID=A0AAU7CB91_9BACT